MPLGRLGHPRGWGAPKRGEKHDDWLTTAPILAKSKKKLGELTS